MESPPASRTSTAPSIKSGNKAAEKFADVADQELLDDIAAFLTKGAKDGDSPASCN